MLRRVPIRLKVTAAFASVMTLVLVATGVFLYLSFKADLNRSVDRGLRTRAADVSALIDEADHGLRTSSNERLARDSDDFAQILSLNGAVFDTTPKAPDSALLSASELARAKQGTISVDRAGGGSGDEATRLLATPVSAQDRRLVVVVGASLEHRDSALAKLQGLLVLGGLGALLMSSLAGYGMAAGALRPVESMRRRAATISGAEAGTRLPVPPADDELGRLGETLNEMLSRLETALEHERGFVADASHELRSPLATMRTELELALRQSWSVEELRAALRSATDETDQLCRLSEDLLVLARSDHGRLPVHPEELQVSEVLRHIEDRFTERSRTPGARSKSSAATACACGPTPCGWSRHSRTWSTMRFAMAAGRS